VQPGATSFSRDINSGRTAISPMSPRHSVIVRCVVGGSKSVAGSSVPRASSTMRTTGPASSSAHGVGTMPSLVLTSSGSPKTRRSRASAWLAAL